MTTLICRLCAAVIATAAAVPVSAAVGQSAPKITRDECIRHGRFVVEVARVCEAAYGLCSNPPSAAWRNGPNVKLACDQVMRERQLRSSTRPADMQTLRPTAPNALPTAPASVQQQRPAGLLQPPPGRP